MNYFENFKEYVSEELVRIISRNLNETPKGVNTAIESMMQSLVGGLMKRTTSTMGLNQLFSHVNKGNYNEDWLKALPDILQNPEKTKELVSNGGSLTSQLFPAMKSQISGMVLDLAGIRSSSASSLISIVTPMVVGVLNKVTQENNLNADGLAEYLNEQKEALVNSVNPTLLEKMVNVLALQDILNGKVTPAKSTPVLPIATKATSKPVVEDQHYYDNPPAEPASKYLVPEEKPTSNKWLWIGIGALSLVLAGFLGYRYFSTQSLSETDIDTTSVVSPSPADSVLGAAPAVADSSLAQAAQTIAPSDTVAIEAPAVVSNYKAKTAFGKQLLAANVGSSISMTGLDYETGSVNLIDGSAAVISDLTAIMNANPNLQIKIINLSNDAQGQQSNTTLSISRAFDLKKKLMVAGIDVIRVDAAGLGGGVNNANQKNVIVKVVKK